MREKRGGERVCHKKKHHHIQVMMLLLNNFTLFFHFFFGGPFMNTMYFLPTSKTYTYTYTQQLQPHMPVITKNM